MEGSGRRRRMWFSRIEDEEGEDEEELVAWGTEEWRRKKS